MEYLNKMKTVHNLILEYLDNEEDNTKFGELVNLLNFQNPQSCTIELNSVLHHHRNPLFFDKIKKIIFHFKKEIIQTFSNIEIYNIFKNNKLILLFLIDEAIMTFNSELIPKIGENKSFFYPEINKLNQNDKQIEIPEFYDEKRRDGENDLNICKIIREDNIKEFIIYYTKNEIQLSKPIPISIYETNQFLEGKNVTIMEYSTFFGSIQIFRFLFQNQVELTPSLWLYAIHGNNPEIIHFLDENRIYPKDESYQECLEESIKCHHNDFAFYFKNNFINDDDHLNFNKNELEYGFHYNNFEFIPIELKEPFCFFYAIEYDYYELVKYYKNIKGLNINESIILIKKYFFFYEISNYNNFQ